MRRLPHIPHGDLPHTILDLGNLSDIHPAPILAYFDLVRGADLDPLALLLQDDILTWTDRPFANPLPILGPHAQIDVIGPVI